MTSVSTVLPYPHPVLDKIEGEPTAISVNKLRKQLYANAREIPSYLAIEHGWLGMLLTPSECTAHFGTDFVPPVHPGARPLFVPPMDPKDTTAMNIARHNWDRELMEYEYRKTDYATYVKVRGDLRQQLLAAVDPIYFGEVPGATALTGLGSVHPRVLLQKLIENYCNLNGHEYESYRRSLTGVADPSLPIFHMLAKVREIREVLATVNPISDGVAIMKTLESLEATGAYERLVTVWYDRAYKDPTWDVFAIHCIRYDKLRREATSTGGTYTTGRSAAYSRCDDRSAISPVTSGDFNMGRDAITTVSASRSTGKTNCGKFGEFRVEFCWSHGMVHSSEEAPHNSKTCKKRKFGHLEEATVFKRMGGSERISFGDPGHRRDD